MNRLEQGGGEDRGYLCNYMYSYKTVSTTIPPPTMLYIVVCCMWHSFNFLFPFRSDRISRFGLSALEIRNGLSINDIIFFMH